MRLHLFAASSAALLLSLQPATAQEANKSPRVAAVDGAQFSMRSLGDPVKGMNAWPLVQMLKQPDFADAVEEFVDYYRERLQTHVTLGETLQELKPDTGDSDSMMARMGAMEAKINTMVSAMYMSQMQRPFEDMLRLWMPELQMDVYLGGMPKGADEPIIDMVFLFELPAGLKAQYRDDFVKGFQSMDVDVDAALQDAPTQEILGGFKIHSLNPAFERFMRTAAGEDVPDDIPFQMFFGENGTQMVFVMGTTEDPLSRLQAAGTEAAAANSSDSVGYEVQVNIADLLAMPGAMDGTEEERKILSDITAMIGIKDVQTASMQMSFGADGVRTGMKITDADGFDGLLGCLKGDDTPHTVTPMEAESGLMHISWAVDLVAATKTVRGFIQQEESRQKAELERIREEMKKEMEEAGEQWNSAVGIGGDRQESSGPISKEVWDMIVAALDGRMSLGIATPKMGAQDPRIAMTWGIKDSGAFDQLMARMQQEMEGIDFVTDTYEGYQWTRIVIPNAPAIVVPCFAKVGDLVYIGTNPSTLWGMLDEVKAGNLTHGIDASQAPDGFTTGPANALQVVYDTGRTMDLMQGTYMRMARLFISMGLAEQGINLDDMFPADALPETEEWLPYLGVGTGGIRIDDNSIEIGSRGVMGGPLATLAGSFVLPILPTLMDLDITTKIRETENQIAAARGKSLANAIQAWRQSFGGGERLPPDLGALLARGLITDETLLLTPGDKQPDVVEFENEDGEIEELDCSFRYIEHDRMKVSAMDLYFADTLNQLDWPGSDHPGFVIMLYEARDTGRGRIVVTRDGTVVLLDRSSFQELLGVR